MALVSRPLKQRWSERTLRAAQGRMEGQDLLVSFGATAKRNSPSRAKPEVSACSAIGLPPIPRTNSTSNKNAHILRYGHSPQPLQPKKQSAQRREHLGRNLFHRTNPLDPAVLRRTFGSRQVLVEIHQRLGLRMVDRQTMTHGLFLVVITLDQLFTGFIILARDLRRLVLGVIDTA